MTIGLVKLHFLIPGSRSLKDKRRVVSSLKQVMRNRFNCSVAEVGDTKDLWGRAAIAACVVSDESRHANEQLNEIVRFASRHGEADLVDYHIEML